MNGRVFILINKTFKLSAAVFTAAVMLTGCSSGDHTNNKTGANKFTSNNSKNSQIPVSNAIVPVAVNIKQYPAVTKHVYLTFDDGPSIYSPKILEILQQNNAKATFFEIGRNVATLPQNSKLLNNAGMKICEHSWKHDDLTTLTNDQITNDVKKTTNIISSTIGKKPDCIRPPYGAINHRVKEVLKQNNIRPVLWNIDTMDWSRPGTKHIIDEVEKNVQNDSVILMHDGGGNREETVAALPIVIEYLKNHGYGFSTIS